jgi:hypothetical protein
MMRELRADEMHVLDLENIMANDAPRVLRAVSEFSDIGKECRRRAILEGERRCCGNNGFELTGAPVEVSERSELASMMDPRSLMTVVVERTVDEKKALKKKLKKLYVEYGTNAFKKELAATAAVAASRWAAMAAESAESAMQRAAVAAQEVAARKAAQESAAQEVAAQEAAQESAAQEVGSQEAGWFDDVDDSEEDHVEEEEEAKEEEEEEEEILSFDELIEKNTRKLKAEFHRVFTNWMVALKNVDWARDFGVKLSDPPDIQKDLIKFPMGKLYLKMKRDDPELKKLGYLPYMATHSRASVGTLLAASFCERINSAGKLIMTKKNTKLKPDEVDMLATLRINRNFMLFMWENYPHIAEQQFGMVPVVPAVVPG